MLSLLHCKIVPFVLQHCRAVIMTISECVCFFILFKCFSPCTFFLRRQWDAHEMHSTTCRKVTGTQRWLGETRAWRQYCCVVKIVSRRVQAFRQCTVWKSHSWFISVCGVLSARCLLALYWNLNRHAFANKPKPLSLLQCLRLLIVAWPRIPIDGTLWTWKWPHEFRRLL